MIIAIDGPSGAGKSTVSKAVARRLGFSCLDTGAMYRSIAWQALQNGVSLEDGEALGRIADMHEIGFSHEPGDPLPRRVSISGVDVTDAIRLPEVSRYASLVSAYPEVRAYLLEMQRQLARENSVVMDGRDIGTVVLPDAEVKVFLTASAEERARRRMLELEERGTPEPYAAILRAIQERDWNDTHRDAAPLRQAEDAVLLDTTALDFVQSEDALLHIIRERTGL